MLRTIQWEKAASFPLRRIICAAARPAAMAAAMFFMMHAGLLLRAAPMAAALMAASLAAGESAGALVVGCLLGMLRLPLSQAALLPAISCTLVLAQELLFGLLPKLRWADETRVSLFAGLAVLLPAMFYANGDPFASLQAIACGALAASAAPFMLAFLRRKKVNRRLSIPERTGAALIFGGCIAALWQIYVPIAECAACLLVLLLPGPATGVLTGIALAAGGAGLVKTAALSLCALVSGSPLFRRRWQRALAVCIASGLAYLMTGPEGMGAQWMLCAAAIWLLLPEKLLQQIRETTAPRRESTCNPEEIAREATRENRRRITALAEAFSTMAEGCVAAVDVPDEQELICEMRSRLCAGCPTYGDCWAGEDNRAVRLLCGLIGEALDRVDAPPGMRILFSDGEIPPDVQRACRRGRMIPDRLGLLLRDFAEKRRSEIKRCANGQIMSIQFLQAREILLNLARQPDTFLHREALNNALACAGLEDCEALPGRADASSVTLMRPDKNWTRSEIARAAGAIGNALGGKYLPRTDGDSLYFVRAPRLSADTGSSCQSGVAGEICGDSHLIRMLGEDKLMLAISDGMGSGEAASAESREALRLLWRFLDAGLSRNLALETVNRQLLMGSGEDIFATIDLCVIDLNTGVAEFTKLAACPTLILRGRELLHVDGGRLPLGILENVQPGVRRLRLRPGDMLVMGSDGVMEAGDGLLIERIARENTAAQASHLAEMLVREAALQRSDNRQDDLTCICVRICSAK